MTGEGTVEVAVGDEVVLRLPENAPTGYVWSIHSLGEGLLLVGDTTLPGDTAVPSEPPLISSPGSSPGSPTDEPPAAGGTRVLRLRAVGPTGHEVVLHLRNEWEAEPLEERRITVAVRR